MRRTFRTYAIGLGLVAAMSLMSCFDSDVDFNPIDGIPPGSDTRFEAEEPFAEDVAVANRSRFRLNGVRGSITITGQSGATTIRITGTKRVGSNSTQDARDHLPNLEVNVRPLATEVFVETVQPIFDGRRYEVDYAITVPTQWAIEVTHMNGDVTLDAIDSDVVVTHGNGDVTLMDIVGSAQVDLGNGRIDSDVTLPLNGSIDFDLMNGPITLAIPVDTSATFSATVGIGSIRVSPNLMLQDPVSTPTSLSGTLSGGEGTISLETNNGTIRVSGV
jgi:hypothetical protein